MAPIATYFPCLANCEIGLVPDMLADLGMKGASPVLETDGISRFAKVLKKISSPKDYAGVIKQIWLLCSMYSDI